MIEAVRAWAARYSAEGRYSPVGQAFHWVMAGLVLFQLGWGWHMGRVPVGADKLRAYELHAELGFLMLSLACLRFLWRLIVPGPVNDADDLGWQTIAARAIHILFYVCFFGLPLTGWAMWSVLGVSPPLSIAGVIPMPQMPFHTIDPGIQFVILDWAERIHWLLVILLLLMVPMHVGAALKHHFWDRHDVLRGMLPELPEDEGREVPRPGLQPDEARPAQAGG